MVGISPEDEALIRSAARASTGANVHRITNAVTVLQAGLEYLATYETSIEERSEVEAEIEVARQKLRQIIAQAPIKHGRYEEYEKPKHAMFRAKAGRR